MGSAFASRPCMDRCVSQGVTSAFRERRRARFHGARGIFHAGTTNVWLKKSRCPCPTPLRSGPENTFFSCGNYWVALTDFVPVEAGGGRAGDERIFFIWSYLLHAKTCRTPSRFHAPARKNMRDPCFRNTDSKNQQISGSRSL